MARDHRGYSMVSGRRERRTLELPAQGLRLAVVSDTHSAPHPAAHGLVAREAPDAILHGGDIGDLRVLDALAEIAPVIAVRGNIDDATDGAPPEVVDLRIVAGAEERFSLLLTHIAVRGTKLRKDAKGVARALDAQLVVCGHSHMPLIASDAGIAVFNPGSIGPRRFGLPITFGVIEIADAGVRMRHIDCETGLGWRPTA